MREVTNNNALVIKTIEGKSSLVASAIKTPTPNSNQALIRVSHVAQNAIDGMMPVPPGSGRVRLMQEQSIHSTRENTATGASLAATSWAQWRRLAAMCRY